ncbi:transposase [Treponema socranskii]|uniref:transposase n=1 Tax=Treponema socranskii TaxID=53419 RepID=UPI0036F42A43
MENCQENCIVWQDIKSKILKGHMLNDHIHILIEILPKYSVAQVMRYIKGGKCIV